LPSNKAPAEPVVVMRNIVKRFPGVVANDDVSIEVYPGEVLALLGENGAGKTTLMNILYGLYKPNSGEIIVSGKQVSFRSPRDAILNGIGMVHQHFMLIDDFTVVENIILGLSEFGIIIDFKTAIRRIEEISRKFGLQVDPYRKIWQLSAGEKQRVEIVKALFRNAKILILDEPTSVLTPQESEALFKTLRKFVEAGMAVIFITHKLQEVMAVADRIVVLRKGKVVGRLRREEATIPQLARMMVGREVLFKLEKKPVTPGKKALEVKGLWVMGDKGVPAVKDVSLQLRCGEILGIAGIAGNGQKELVEAIYGLRSPIKGTIKIFGYDMVRGTVRDRILRGISLIPEERIRIGIIPDFSTAENLVLEQVDFEPFSKPILGSIKKIDFEKINRYAEKLIKEFNIVTPSPSTRAANLSGGNIQRLILARELSRGSDLIIAEEPTAGLDVGATEYIRKLLLEARSNGKAVLLVSGELSEVLSLSDKVVVMYEGEIVGGFKPGTLSLEDVGLLMAGAKRMSREEVAKLWT